MVKIPYRQEIPTILIFPIPLVRVIFMAEEKAQTSGLNFSTEVLEKIVGNAASD